MNKRQIIKIITGSAVSSLAIIAISLFAFNNAVFAATCDRACLLEQAKQFNANMLARTTKKIPLGSNAQIRENTKAIELTESKWLTVAKILSEGVYADVTQGNVIEHTTAETSGGKTVYIGTRLKLVNKKITEVEINFDDSPNVNVKNLVPYDPLFNTIVSPEQRILLANSTVPNVSIFPATKFSFSHAAFLLTSPHSC